MEKNYKLIKCDENVYEGKNFYFTLSHCLNLQDLTDRKEVEFFINPYGMIFMLLDDEHSVTLGLRDFMNSGEDFQQCIFEAFNSWREKRRVLHKIDE